MGLFNKRKLKKAAEREAREKQELARKIREQAKQQSDQWLKIIHDCVNLVNTTKNPEVFFQRYNLMLEHLEKCAGLECTGIYNNSRELPSTAFLRIEKQFTIATNDFIDRSFEEAKTKAETLKTVKGKRNTIMRFFDNMETYIIYMEHESVEYLDNLKQKALDELQRGN